MAAPAAQRNRQSESPYQQRTTQKDNPTQLLIKQAVDYLMQQLEQGHSEVLTAYLTAMGRFHTYSFLCCAQHKKLYVICWTMLIVRWKGLQGACFRALQLT